LTDQTRRKTEASNENKYCLARQMYESRRVAIPRIVLLLQVNDGFPGFRDYIEDLLGFKSAHTLRPSIDRN
jgi:hypothetical protein